MEDFIIEARGLRKSFALGAGFFARADRRVYAVNDVSFGIARGRTYGLVGESGCGKTTTARLLVRMYRADGGSVLFSPGGGAPRDAARFGGRELRAYRERVKYVFQDPSRSLDPRMSVLGILSDALRWSSLWRGKADARERAAGLMEEVGLDPRDLDRRPGEFSGGQRQRISIARGLMMRPDVLICDEVVSALDVSVQGQILNLLQDLRERRGLSFLFIAHDLRVSGWFCDVIGVMYSGVLVEEAPAADLFRTAAHPYTRLLYDGSENRSGSGEVKTALVSPTGCPFAPRCPHASPGCRESMPGWSEVAPGHKVRCRLFG